MSTQLSVGQVKEDIERARRIQDSLRKDAPEVTANASFHDPREEMTKRLVPKAYGAARSKYLVGQNLKILGGKGAEVAVRFTAKEKYATYVNRGWEPVTDSITGDVAQHEGDLLMKRPIEFSQREDAANGERSRQRVKGEDLEDANNSLMKAHKKIAPDDEEITVQTIKT